MAGRVLMAARWVVGHQNGNHVLYEDGEVVFEGDRIVFVGHERRHPLGLGSGDHSGLGRFTGPLPAGDDAGPGPRAVRPLGGTIP